MTFLESVLTGLTCITTVFIVLASLWGLIRLTGVIVQAIEKGNGKG